VPSVRIVLLALLTGVAVGLYFALWFHWPTFLAVGGGAVMGILLLLVAASLGDDPAAADAAWREAAPDLVTARRSDDAASAGDADLREGR
jgi:predicted MFS family arabinose efflux permease